jgi:single-strand DNA-binding protein
MQNYTTATIEGYVTHDPVLRTTKTGKNICMFSVAINHFSNPDSSPRVSFIDIETWEKTADLCAKSVAKGKHILVAGSLRQDRWEGKDGKTQSKLKLVGTQVRFLDPSRDGKPAVQEAAQPR